MGDESTQDLTGPPTVDMPLWRRLVPFAIGAGCVAIVVSTLDFARFLEAIAGVNYALYSLYAVTFTGSLLVADCFATSFVYRMTVCPVRFSEFFVIRAASYLPSIVNHHLGQAWVTYFVSRVYGAPVWRVAGATLVVYATIFACVCLLVMGALPFSYQSLPWLAPLVGVVVVAGLGYLAVIHRKPPFMLKLPPTKILVEVGVIGHLRVMIRRLPHVSVLFLGTWASFWFFGVSIAPGDALALIPPLMIVSALPISPQGVGTRDMVAVLLLSEFAEGDPETARASVAASTLTFAVAMTVVQMSVSPLFLKAAYRLLNQQNAKRSEQAEDSPAVSEIESDAAADSAS